MVFDSITPAADPLIDAAAALLEAFAAGLIAVSPAVDGWQCGEIERELRIDAQILPGVAAGDRRTIAAEVVCNVRHGLATGSLIVTRDDAGPYVLATIAAAVPALDASQCAPAVCFDAPAEIGGCRA